MVADVARGGSPRPIKDYLTDSPQGVNWIKIGDTEKGGKYINSTKEKIKPCGVSRSRLIHKGDFLLTNSMSFGRPYISNIEGCIHDGWLVISPATGTYTQDFLFYLLSSRFAYDQFCGKVSGAVVQNLNSDKVADAIFPIPPFEEQQRIVSRLESVMPHLDKYGKAQEEQDLLNASINSRLRKSILQDAICGKLVAQSSDDVPASNLLEQIRLEKQRLLKLGLIKNKDVIDSVIFKGEDNRYYEQVGVNVTCIEDELPFEIPASWAWCRIGEIADLYTGNSISESEKKAKYTNVDGMRYIGTKDVSFNYKINYDNGIAIPEGYRSKFKIAPTDSILLCVEGGSAGRKIALTHQEVCFGNKLCCFAFFAPSSVQYVYDYLQSASFYDSFSSKVTGIIGGVGAQTLKSLFVPLPPIGEQVRIVAQIEKLFEQLR